MGEANFYYFTCLNFKRVKFWLNQHNDALFPRPRESRQVSQGAWRQLARSLQEHARSRKSHQGNGAQTRHQIPQECLREERDYSFQTLRWRPRSPRSGQSLERVRQPGTLAQEIRRILPFLVEERGIERGLQRPRRRPPRRRSRSSQSRRADEAQNVPRPRQNQRLHVLSLPYRSYSHRKGRRQGERSD